VDGIMVDSSGEVVVIESKKPTDLRNSHKNRRLARQLKTAIEMGDKVLLLIRPVWSLTNLDGSPNFSLFVDIARFQRMGIFVLPGPKDDKQLARWLWYYKKVLGEEKSTAMRSLIGEDQSIDKNEPWYWLKSLKGMGPVQLAKAKMAFITPWDFLCANDAELRAFGMNSKVVKERRLALNGSTEEK